MTRRVTGGAKNRLIEIELENGRRVRVDRDVDAAALERVLERSEPLERLDTRRPQDRLLDRHSNHHLFDLDQRAVLQDWLALADLL
ncbi:MAG TPA: hypothetical protein VGJ20_42260 [Xanthobacteraceae bacterium]